MRRHYSPWELLFFIIVAAVIVQVAVDVITSLVPYILLTLLIVAVGSLAYAAYKRRQNW